MQAPPIEGPKATSPYKPPGPPVLVFEDWAGIDTQVPRAGVANEKMAWCDGFMPIAKRNLRTMYGVGTALYTATGGLTVKLFGFYNLGSTAYCAVFLSDGSILQIRVSDGASTTIADPGTILNPSIVNVGMTQSGQLYLIIVANQVNGYWIWNGTLFFKAGGVGPLVTLTNTGSGYRTVPTITASGGSGSGATFVASIANGIVTNVVVTNPGTGYLPGQTITLNFSGGNASGSGGVLTANLTNTGSGSGATFTIATAEPFPNNWGVTGVTVTNGGTGYSEFTTLTFTAINNLGQVMNTISPAVLQPVISGGVITGVTIVNGGAYSPPFPQPPFVTSINNSTLVASDSGAFIVSSVTVNNGGSNYSASAIATASGGGTPIAQATFQLVLSGGVITGVTVASGGLYGSNVPPAVTVTDAAVNAQATAELMPFGVQGTAVETYAGHVWVVNGAVLLASVPGDPTNFATTAGGFSGVSNNSNLKVGYTQLISTNGFLYLIGDSATDYVSGVTVANGIISFSWLNADPDTGSPYPASVLTFGNAIVLGNSVGVHFLAGSTFTKISDALDGSGLPKGLWNSVANFGGNQLSSAKANIFNKKIWMILATVIDPISLVQTNKIFLWGGQRWWSSQQDVALTFIAAQEINSVYTAYGTDGTHIYPLFNTPSTGFTKTVQSGLWDAPGGYVNQRASNRLFGLAYFFDMTNASYAVTIDNETGSTPPYTIAAGGVGYAVMPPQAVGQTGVLEGMTVTTTAKDMSLLSAALDTAIVQYRG